MFDLQTTRQILFVTRELICKRVTPLFWELAGSPKPVPFRNGTVSFIDTGTRKFAVTAAHVVNQWRADKRAGRAGLPQLGQSERTHLDLERRIIDIHDEIDLCTFEMADTEVAKIRKEWLRGVNPVWPPEPPQRDKGIISAGYAAAQTIWLREGVLSFGAVFGAQGADSVSDLTIGFALNRDELMAVDDNGLPPENFDFRGMSGGLVLTVVGIVGSNVHGWRLGGIIIEGPNPEPTEEIQAIDGVEIFKARRADFVNADGTLNRTLWDEYAWLRRKLE